MKNKNREAKERRNTIIYVVLEKVFWRSFGLVWVNKFPTLMNENEITQTPKFIDKMLTRTLWIEKLSAKENFFYSFQGKKLDQVCGKNNITYHSWCHLMKDSCNTGFFIDLKHEGPCIESSWYIIVLLLEAPGPTHIGNGLFFYLINCQSIN